MRKYFHYHRVEQWWCVRAWKEIKTYINIVLFSAISWLPLVSTQWVDCVFTCTTTQVQMFLLFFRFHWSHAFLLYFDLNKLLFNKKTKIPGYRCKSVHWQSIETQVLKVYLTKQSSSLIKYKVYHLSLTSTRHCSIASHCPSNFKQNILQILWNIWKSYKSVCISYKHWYIVTVLNNYFLT